MVVILEALMAHVASWCIEVEELAAAVAEDIVPVMVRRPKTVDASVTPDHCLCGLIPEWVDVEATVNAEAAGDQAAQPL